MKAKIPKPNFDIYNELMRKAVWSARKGYSCIVYLFDENRNEIGYFVDKMNHLAVKRSGKWDKDLLNEMNWTKIK